MRMNWLRIGSQIPQKIIEKQKCVNVLSLTCSCKHSNRASSSIKCKEFIGQLSNHKLLKEVPCTMKSVSENINNY
jgi:hypothetical protein